MRAVSNASARFAQVLCLFANDTSTNMRIEYADENFSNGKVASKSWGDGTVPLRSLRWCSEWNTASVVEFELGGSLSAHTEIVRSPAIIEAVATWVTAGSALEQRNEKV